MAVFDRDRSNRQINTKKNIIEQEFHPKKKEQMAISSDVRGPQKRLPLGRHAWKNSSSVRGRGPSFWLVHRVASNQICRDHMAKDKRGWWFLRHPPTPSMCSRKRWPTENMDILWLLHLSKNGVGMIFPMWMERIWFFQCVWAKDVNCFSILHPYYVCTPWSRRYLMRRMLDR